MDVIRDRCFEIDHASRVAEARQSALEAAARLGFDEESAGRLALVVTEAGTNIVKHVRAGQLIVRVVPTADGPAVEILALDRGPGIADLGRSLADGYSTAGSPGTGLGALTRLADGFDIHTRPGAGTAVLARVVAHRSPAPRRPRLHTEGLSLAKPGEEVCGDAWADEPRADGTMILVADGLGHGAGAAEAAQAAVAAFRGSRDPSPVQRLHEVHRALRSTRGAAVAIADLDCHRRLVRFAGVGNVAGAIVADGTTRQMVSRDGTAGAVAARLPEFAYPWSPGAVLVLYSDGLTSHVSLAAYPGLSQRHPSLIAGVLLRDFTRGRDDATVVVCKEPAA
jgi:anti-sigma regulatory factor (Ser/Thr protein kinase)